MIKLKSTFFIGILLCLFSCTNNEVQPIVEEETTSNFETFKIYGELHNAMLKQITANFSEPTGTSKDKESALNYLLSMQQNDVSALPLSSRQKELLSNELETYKSLYVTKDLIEAVQSKESRSDIIIDYGELEFPTVSVIMLIEEAYESGEIDEFEYNSFMLLVDYVEANAAGTLSNQEFEAKIRELVAQWEVIYADVDFTEISVAVKNATDDPIAPDPEPPHGAIGGLVLSISTSSLEYWNDENNQLEESRAVPVFVGADIAGAVLGALHAGIISHASTGHINWEHVAWSSAAGAITGSSGIVGKIGKWLSGML